MQTFTMRERKPASIEPSPVVTIPGQGATQNRELPKRLSCGRPPPKPHYPFANNCSTSFAK